MNIRNEGGPIGLFSEVWREAPIDETDPGAVCERDRLRSAIFGVFFGEVDKHTGERPRLPFSVLPVEAVDSMSPGVREAYESEFAVAQDPRSGKLPQVHPSPDTMG